MLLQPSHDGISLIDACGPITQHHRIHERLKGDRALRTEAAGVKRGDKAWTIHNPDACQRSTNGPRRELGGQVKHWNGGTLPPPHPHDDNLGSAAGCCAPRETDGALQPIFNSSA